VTEALDLAAAQRWVETVVGPVDSIDVVKERAWATVARVVVGGEAAWFKACQPVQAFEPRLTAGLARRWPDRLSDVLAVDEARAWLLTADAGVSVGTLGNPPETWLRALPRYAELQLGETRHAADHRAHGVPDLGLAGLPGGYERLLANVLPLERGELDRLRRFEPRFVQLCSELEAAGLRDAVQHDDLHVNSLFVRGEEIRFLDWGDASIAQPFFSLVATFWFLERHNGLQPSDPWFARLRDAYLEPWGGGALRDTFALAFRVGLVAHPIAWLRHRDAMPPEARVDFDRHFAELLRWVIPRALG
jgi:hypothetical protein